MGEQRTNVGVSIGDASSLVAALRDERPEVIANDLGERITPTVVAYGEEVTVGHAAKQGVIRNSQQTVDQFVSIMGVPFTEIEGQKRKTCQPTSKKGRAAFPIETKFHTPSEVLTQILTNLKVTAKQFVGTKVNRAVYAVPVYLNAEGREALCEAARNSGMLPSQLISEPAAAALAYGLGQDDKDASENFIVFNIGASKTSATAMKLAGGMFQTITSVTHDVGGNAIDQEIVKHLKEEFKRKMRMDIADAKRPNMKLQRHAETAKKVLSTHATTSLSIESLFEGMDFQHNLSRGRVEGFCGTLLRKCVGPLEELLKKTPEVTYEKVLLAGGGCKIPRVKALVKSIVGSATIMDGISPDEVVVLGAATQAALLEDPTADMENDVKLFPANTYSIAVTVPGNDTPQVVIPAGTPFPHRISAKLTTAADNQTVIQAKFYELNAAGEVAQQLASLQISDLEAKPAGQASIALTVELAKDGHVRISAANMLTKNKTQAVVPVATS